MSYFNASFPINGVKIKEIITPSMKIGRKFKYFSNVSPTAEKSKWFNILINSFVGIEKSIYIATILIKLIVKNSTKISILTNRSFTMFLSLL